MEKRLAERFIRIHQRFLINPEYVDCLGADAVLLNGQELPCSRKYKEQTAARIARSLIGSNTLQT